MGVIAWIVLGLGAGLLAGILLLAYHLATSRTTRTGRYRHSHRSYGSGSPVLARAEKRLCQDQDRQPLAGQRRVCQDKPPL
jgi:hypothetical protein